MKTESIKQFSEQIKNRQNVVKGEEATKQALVLPFLQFLGFDVWNPEEVKPEFIADFSKRKSGPQEKVDYAIFVSGQPYFLIEVKSSNSKLDKHDGQLARYFNSLPSVKIGILTNGLIYKFYTDLKMPNVMDEEPYLEINVLDLQKYEEFIKLYSKDKLNTGSLKEHAEEVSSIKRITSFIADLIANPTPDFVKFTISNLGFGIRITEKVIEKYTPIIKKAFNSAILKKLEGSFSEKSSSKEESKIVTTSEEIEAFNIIKKHCEDSETKLPITHKDTIGYFGINLGSSKKWFIRLYLSGSTKYLVLRDVVSIYKKLDPDLLMEELGQNTKIYFDKISDLNKLGKVIKKAYELEAMNDRSTEADLLEEVAQ